MLSLQGKDWTCSSYAERSQCSKMRFSECRAELVHPMPSVSILGEANVQKCDLASAELNLFILCRA